MPTATTAFATWTVPFWATLSLLLTALVYTRGWRQIRRTRPTHFPAWRLACFLGGLATVWIAIASPLDSLANLLLIVHMTQHVLLMSLAPPLLVLGAPMVPMLRGLPRSWVREGIGPFFTLAPMRWLERLLKSRVFAWLAMNTAFLAWHIPAAYDLALAHPQLHEVEHACFLLTSVLFWWPIIEPWPTVYKGSRWMLLPYLMSADIVNTALSAFLSFSGRVVYPAYLDAPRLFGITALNDQIAAGSLMWVLGSTAFLVPVMAITMKMLSRRGERRAAARIAHANALLQQVELEALYALPSDPASSPGAAPVGGARGGRKRSGGDARGGLDLFTVAGLGAFFRSRYGRQTLQAVLLLIAAAVIVDGFFGHPMGAMNLAGIVPWTYARALFVLALLLVGNLFCMSCPFMLPRELAKRVAVRMGFARLPWPQRLRGKWFSAGLLAVFFWAYEALALWNSPWRTAWLLVAYFLTALVLDSIFRGASFCKYVCPLGQFNFVSSLVSPVELSARSQSTCASCSTRDCIAGRHDERDTVVQRGCELDLFMPAKSGNLDCTLCMDCVKACPHENIGLFVQAPARELVQLAVADPQRSSVGRFSRRPDLAAVALVMVAAAFASAAVMVSPVALVLDQVAAALPARVAPTAGLGLALACPALLLGLLALAVAGMGDAGEASLAERLCRWSLALLPLGLGMWAAHLSFHLLTGWNSLWPGVQQAMRDLAPALGSRLGVPDWTAERSLASASSLLPLQLLLLDAGLLLALYVGWRMVRPGSLRPPGTGAGVVTAVPTLAQSVAAMAPWALLVLLLYAAGVWVLLEPMQMRGMMGM